VKRLRLKRSNWRNGYVLKTDIEVVPSVRERCGRPQEGERKKAEESLRRSEVYLEEAQSSSYRELRWRPSTGEILWSEETFESSNTTIDETDHRAISSEFIRKTGLGKRTVERATQEEKI